MYKNPELCGGARLSLQVSEFPVRISYISDKQSARLAILPPGRRINERRTWVSGILQIGDSAMLI